MFEILVNILSTPKGENPLIDVNSAEYQLAKEVGAIVGRHTVTSLGIEYIDETIDDKMVADMLYLPKHRSRLHTSYALLAFRVAEINGELLQLTDLGGNYLALRIAPLLRV